ncbi:alkaline phosphatase [Halobacillus litoralis]|uniref:alkaline phosphatase n=1 Tax=Halobacillus litoralis TaxID=45668 RepID=UPI001CD4F279|nr:alkaline phosphatase [Halobacillus litoralis]MCA1022200.1 alkaline phosphatase [Halobacillus litoralis]
MKKQLAKKVLSVTALSCLFFGSADDPSFISAADHSRGVKNIIFMIGDGMGPEYTTGYRYYKDNPETKDMEPTAFDPYLAGMQSVYSYDFYHEGGGEEEKENITDSAAAGTALSSGIKTYNGAIAKDLDKEDTKTVLEAAKEKGMSTGLVVTAQVNHATPAAYGAHNESRQNYDAIADDYFDDQIDGEHKIDVLLGGGTDYFIRDDRDLTKEFQQDGYDYVTTTEEMADSDGGQILGLFAPGGLDKAIDRPKEQPSLAAMTETAIEKLKSNEEGFFLMVEGSQIDWAGHDNDVVAAMSEIEDFEGAFEKVLAFAEEDGRTLVVTTADHSTGGFSLGEGGPYQWDPDVIRAASHTPDYMAGQIVKEGADVKKTLTDAIDFELTGEEIASVQEAVNKGNEEESFAAVDNAIEAIFNKRSGTGWTTDGHTGVDVPVYAYGPASERFSGFMDNTDNAEIIFELLNGSEGEEGAPLADTATSYPLGMLMGAIVAGAGVILFMRRKQVKA